MKIQERLIIVVAIPFFLMTLAAVSASADLTAQLCGKLANLGGIENVNSEGVNTPFVIDTVEGLLNPVPHCYIHGTLAQDARFRILLPKDWNGRYVLGHKGSWGGNEAGPNFDSNAMLTLGYAFAESNQGHIGYINPLFKPSDSWQEMNTIRNHQLTKFAKGKMQKLYGSLPAYSYTYGVSGGGWRSLSLLERYPNEYDGAAVAEPALEPRFLSIFMLSLQDYYLPFILPKLPDIVRARDLEEDPIVFANLTPTQADALNELYDGGATRGGEFTWGLPSLHIGYIVFNVLDPTYLDDFWSKPGYEGHDGVAGGIVEGTTGTVTSVGLPDADGNIFAFTDTAKTFSPNEVRGWSVHFTSGELSGEEFHILSNMANSVTITGSTPVGRPLNGLTAGDTYTLDNRAFLAWKHYHRHVVLCDRPEYKNFCSNGQPIYVQRPPEVQQALTRQGCTLTGKIHAPVVAIAGALDNLVWPPTMNNYFERVRSVFGPSTEKILRVYWQENQHHYGPTPYQINRLVQRDSFWHLGFQLLTEWIEQGTSPPPDTVVNITPGNVIFPASADIRKGIQPTVSFTANGMERITVSKGSTVVFNGVAESPIGKIAKYEWDFESNNAYDCTSGGCGGGPFTPGQVVAVPAVHTYNTVGTFVATVRVTDDTDNPGIFTGGLENLARVVVVVE